MLLVDLDLVGWNSRKSPWTSLEPGKEAVDEVANIDELQQRGDKCVGDGQEEDLVDKPIGVVDVLPDVDVGDGGDEDRVHQLGDDRLKGIANLTVRPGEVTLVVGEPFDSD